MFAAAISFAVGWSGARWIARPGFAAPETTLVAAEESAAAEPPPDSARRTAGVATKERMKAFAAIYEQPASFSRDHAIVSALLKLEAADFPAGANDMLALLKSAPAFNSETGDLAEAWINRWLEVDTPGALRFLTSSSLLAELSSANKMGWPLASSVYSGLGGALRALARCQPVWTRDIVADMKPGKQRETAVYAVMREVARGGVAPSSSFLASFDDPADRYAALTGYVTGLVTTDVRSGFDIACAEPLGELRDELLMLVMRGAGERGVGITSELLDRIDDPGTRVKLASNAVFSIKRARDEDILPFVEAESERILSDGAPGLNSGEWQSAVGVASRGPQAEEFADWAAKFAPDSNRMIFETIAHSWAGSDPVALQGWLSKRATTLDAAALTTLSTPIAMIAERDPDGARLWAEQLPVGMLRNQASFQIALSGARGGSISQAEAAYQSVAGTDMNGVLAKQLAGVLVQRDAAAAARWVMRQTPGEARTAALQVVAGNWSESDPAGAAKWLEKMPAGADRDAAVGTYATRTVVADPDSAAQWVEQIADPGLRTQTAGPVFHHWSIHNPVAARAWLRELRGVDEDLLAKHLRNAR